MNTELPRPIDTIPEWIFERSRTVLLFPDEGKGYEAWSSKIADISREVGFGYEISDFTQHSLPNTGGDIGDLSLN